MEAEFDIEEALVLQFRWPVAPDLIHFVLSLPGKEDDAAGVLAVGASPHGPEGELAVPMVFKRHVCGFDEVEVVAIPHNGLYALGQGDRVGTTTELGRALQISYYAAWRLRRNVVQLMNDGERPWTLNGAAAALRTELQGEGSPPVAKDSLGRLTSRSTVRPVSRSGSSVRH